MTTSSNNNAIPNSIHLPKLPEGFIWNLKSEYYSDRNHWSTSLALFSTPGNGVIGRSIAWNKIINSRAWGHPASFSEIEAVAQEIMEKPMVRFELGLDQTDEMREMCHAAKAGYMVAGLNTDPDFVSMYNRLM